MGACGCFDNRKIINNDNKDNKNIQIIDQVEDSIIKPNYNDYQIETQKGQKPNLEIKVFVQREKILNEEKKKDANNHKIINNKIDNISDKKEESNDIKIVNNDNKNIIKKQEISEIANNKETELSLYKYPSNFEIINQSSTQLKGKKDINIVLIGEKQSGKSCFVIKLSENRFESLYIPTVFIENTSKIMTYNNKKYILNFDVTPGDQEYQQEYSDLYSKAHFIFLFYDVTNFGSFKRAKKFVKKELKNKLLMYPNNCSNIFIIGNKIDITPFTESSSEIKSYCEKHSLQFFEISVKTNSGIGYMMNKVLAIFDNVSS